MRIVDATVNPESKIKPIGPISESDENIPQPKRILAARNRHKNILVGREHFILFDKALGLLRQPLEVMILAQGQLMLAHVDRGFISAFFTFHNNLCHTCMICPKGTDHAGRKCCEGVSAKQSDVCCSDKIASSDKALLATTLTS